MADKKIDKLTPEQEAKIPEYLEKYLKIGLSTEPTDRAKAEKAIIDSYVYQKMPVPKIEWRDDPFEGAKLAAQFAKGDTDVTNEEIRSQANKASYGSFNAQWVVFYSFIANELPVKKDNLINIVDDIILDCGVYWMFKGMVVLTPKPINICMVDKQLHCTTGPALEYGSGKGVYAYKGERCGSLMEVAMKAQYDAEKTKAG